MDHHARSQAPEDLSEDARSVLGWLRSRHTTRGKPRIYSPIEITRSVFGRADGPTPGVMFDPRDWSRVMAALEVLQEHELVQTGRLPQGDTGYRLVTEDTPQAENVAVL